MDTTDQTTPSETGTETPVVAVNNQSVAVNAQVSTPEVNAIPSQPVAPAPDPSTSWQTKEEYEQVQQKWQASQQPMSRLAQVSGIVLAVFTVLLLLVVVTPLHDIFKVLGDPGTGSTRAQMDSMPLLGISLAGFVVSYFVYMTAGYLDAKRRMKSQVPFIVLFCLVIASFGLGPVIPFAVFFLITCNLGNPCTGT